MNMNKKLFLIIFLISSTIYFAGCRSNFRSQSKLESTLEHQNTTIAHLETQISEAGDTNWRQWEAISYLSTQMPFALDLITPIPSGVTLTPTPFAVCTPPACRPDEVHHCPDECPGGCGTTCATPTPGTSGEKGGVLVKVCPPDEGFQPLTIFFQQKDTGEIFPFKIIYEQDAYHFALPGGVYIAFAWLEDMTAAGAYTEYIVCRKLETCNDHVPAPFVVQGNHVTTGIEICDWQVDVSLLPEITK